MKKKGKQLEFISFVKRDGSGTIPVGTAWTDKSDHPKTDDMSYLDNDEFRLNCLSITYGTFIASGMNTWVVRWKQPD